MKKKKLAATLLLSTAAFFGTVSPQVHASSAEEKFVVLFKDSDNLPSGYEQTIKNAGGNVVKSLGKLGAVEVKTTNPNFASQVKKSSLIQDAAKEHEVTPETVESNLLPDFEAGAANDLYHTYQWDIKQVTHDGASWKLPGGTGKSVDGKDIVVGIIDTGIDYDHPDIKQNYAYGKSFVAGHPSPKDEEGHGTHVAGSIAAKGRVLGIGPDLKVAAYRVFAPGASAYTSDIANALTTAADDNVDVVNMSLGGYDWFQDPDYATKDIVADVRLFNRAIQYAIKKGVTVVGSAGNNASDISKPGQLSGDNNGSTHRSPSSQTMIRVSSNGEAKNLAYYSNYGVGKIDVMAPGGDYGLDWLETRDPALRIGTKRCLSTVPGGYAWMQGTSMASPKTAALAGVIIAQHGKDALSPSQVKHIIQKSADDVFKPGNDSYSGFGLINAENALRQ
ncbi:S8 family serine peptidase [Fictibacillus fluitans]|uniref:S8 family serine peptidase n=1 Tax=Fictibacillus fluitans TaxID=3058422 RepID=A0ABT8HQE6_9BACL|nr:S8 family serine peptidase [Fictibacillus sp. NE201]MDN4522998.1 S8 family serine peptidase [Fictibacillus sp. NE201]